MTVRSVFRTLAAWAVTASLVGGMLLPFFTTAAVADPDGACGPVLVLAHSIQHFEAPVDAPTDHCAICHLWNAVAHASVADRAVLSPPQPVLDDARRSISDPAYLSDLTPSSPRGPPAIS